MARYATCIHCREPLICLDGLWWDHLVPRSRDHRAEPDVSA